MMPLRITYVRAYICVCAVRRDYDINHILPPSNLHSSLFLFFLFNSTQPIVNFSQCHSSDLINKIAFKQICQRRTIDRTPMINIGWRRGDKNVHKALKNWHHPAEVTSDLGEVYKYIMSVVKRLCPSALLCFGPRILLRVLRLSSIHLSYRSFF